jgi:putative ATP-dependent endonuclease of the OLD family
MTEERVLTLGVPRYVIFDSDGNITNTNARPKHEKDNKTLLSLLGGDPTQVFPSKPTWSESFAQWPTNLGDLFRSEVGEAEWDKTFGEASKGLGNPEGSYAKNPVHIGDHLQLLHAKGSVPQTLIKLCDEILRFAATK